MIEKSFEIYVKRILATLHPNTKLSSAARTYSHNVSVYLIKRLSEVSNSLMLTGTRVTVTKDVVKNAALICLDDTFGEGSVQFADKAVEKFENAKSTEKTAMATKAGLVFPPSKVHYYFSRYSTKSRYAEKVRVFTTAVVEDVVTFILRSAGSITLANKRTTVSLKDVTTAITRNRDLYNLFSRVDNMFPETYRMEGFLAYEQPKTKKEQKFSQRPSPVVQKSLLDQEEVKLSYSAAKRLGYRAGLRRFGNQVSHLLMGEMYNEVKRVFKFCLVSMNYNKRRTLSPVDVRFALEIVQGGTLVFPFKKRSLIPKKTVQERKGRSAKTQATKTKEWKKKVEYYQNMADHLFFARDSFRRLIHHASDGRMFNNEVDMQSTIGVEQTPQLNQAALDMIQLHCEKHVVHLLRRANNIAVYNERQTVQEKDIYLVIVPEGVYKEPTNVLTQKNLDSITPESSAESTPEE